MLFSSISFIFYFLPAVLLCYFIVPVRFRSIRNAVLLVFSLIFYGIGGPKFLFVMLFSIILNYILGLAVWYTQKQAFLNKCLLTVSVVCNLGVLCYFKYTNFFLSNFFAVLGQEFQALNIVMPIGISFFTFQGLSYVVDVYRNTAKVQKNPLNVALYISMFPQLIAGPIVRYETVAEQISERHENVDQFASGIRRFSVGLAKKMLIGNTMGLIAEQAFGHPTMEVSTATLWLAMAAYTLHIYYDFSGYSDMAIGLGRMFGFEFLENFNYPYISKSITEFWRRWHISLSTWFRDYVYIPLGGNRCRKSKWIRNIFVVWLLTGFWHGASWNFICWGLYFGILLLLEKLWIGPYLKSMPGWMQHIYALLLIMFGWVLFNSANMASALKYFAGLFGLGTGCLLDKQFLYLIMEYKVELIIGVIAAIPWRAVITERMKQKNCFVSTENMRLLAANVYALLLLCFSVIVLVNSSFNPFIYFRF